MGILQFIFHPPGTLTYTSPLQVAKQMLQMKKVSVIILLTLAFLSKPASLFAQQIILDTARKLVDVTPGPDSTRYHYNAVSKRPEFPGGKEAWQDFLRANIDLKIPFLNKAKPGTYEVLARFIVTGDGKLIGIGVDTYNGYGMDGEVVRSIKKSPDWIPAEASSGRKINFTMRTLVTFLVKENDVTLSFAQPTADN